MSRSPELRLNYENLIYSCRTCNAAKGNLLLSDPISILDSTQIVVESDGQLQPLSEEANLLV